MKSLILKDLYNIVHNAKSMLLVLLFLAVVFISTSKAESYVFLAAVLCSVMIVTTFSFDANCNWNRYAMIMPVSKKDLVKSKFIVLLIFNIFGSIFGPIVGTIGGLITNKINFTAETLLMQMFMAVIALVIAEIFGSMAIPLVFKFGAEKARMLLLVSFVLPTAICVGVFYLLKLMGIEITEQFMFVLLCCSPLIAVIWNLIMYKISLNIFEKKDI